MAQATQEVVDLTQGEREAIEGHLRPWSQIMNHIISNTEGVLLVRVMFFLYFVFT